MAPRIEDWRGNWTLFILSVAADFSDGLTANEVTEKYRDQPVEWVGTVTHTNFGDVPWVALEMPAVKVKLADGRHGIVDYLSLVVAQENLDSWRSVKPGQQIKFRTSVRKGVGPFTGLDWAELDGTKGYVSIGTNPSTLLEVLGEHSAP